MWTVESRVRNDRSPRYPSDLDDVERAPIAPGKRGGNKRAVNQCKIANGPMYIQS